MFNIRIQKGLAVAGVAVLLNCGVVAGESGLDKRVEEFKTGLEKNVSVHSEEEKKSAPAHEKRAASRTEGHKKSAAKQKAAHGKGGHTASASHDTAGIGPEEALKKLLEGNKRYAADRCAAPHRSAKRRAAVASGQQPFAVVVGCSDSRVPPELLFDQGFGDLFVVRTAGNIVDSIAIGSIEYAVEHLGVNLIVVLGHERCGAVDATVKGGEAPGSIKTIVETINPAVEKAKGKHGDLLCNAVKANVKMVAEKIKTSSPILAEFIEDGTLKVVGAYYDLDTGSATITYRPLL